MLLSRLIVRTRCYSTSSTSPASSFRLKAPKPAKPLGLKPITSVTYPRNGRCQSHFAYPPCFQRLSLEKRPHFGKRIVQRSRNRCLSRARHSVSCSPTRHVVTRRRAGSENIPTKQAGMWFVIRSLTGKLRISFGCQPISYRSHGCRGAGDTGFHDSRTLAAVTRVTGTSHGTACATPGSGRLGRFSKKPLSTIWPVRGKKDG